VKRDAEVTLFFSQPESPQQALFRRRPSARLARGRLRSRWRAGLAFDPQGRPSFQVLQNNLSRFIEKRPWSYISPLEGDSKDHHRAFLSEAAMITKTKVWGAAKLLPC
jgi:hypothetical protein